MDAVGRLGARYTSYDAAHQGHEDQVVVEARANEENEVAHRLEELKCLPLDGKRKGPDENSPNTVQDHTSGGIHPLRDGETGEVEEGDADDEAKVGQQKLPVVSHLDDAINGVFEAHVVLPEVRRGRQVPGDEVHGEEEDEQESETKDSFPPHALQWRHFVLLDDLLLHRHLNGRDTLSKDDQKIAREHQLLRHTAAIALPKHVVSDPNHQKAQDHNKHARPLKPLELVIKESYGQNTREDDDAASQHLEAGSISPGEPQVHGGGAGKVTRCRDGPHKGVEFLGTKQADVLPT